MPLGRTLLNSSAVLLLAALPLVSAHGDEHEAARMAMDMGGVSDVHSSATSIATAVATSAAPNNYFRYPEFAGWMYAHIALMTIAWAVVLPVCE